MPDDSPPPPAALSRPRAALVLCACLGVAVIYYRLTWPDLPSFSLALDKGRTLFGDLRHHYLPTGASVLAGGGPTPWFLYPPLTALGFSLLARLPPETAWLTWGAFELACTLALYAVTADALRSRPRAFWAHAVLFPLSVPVLHNFKWGQFSTPLVLCVLAALFSAESRPRVSTVLLGLATSIKPFFAPFVLPHVLRRPWRSVLGWGAATTAFVLAPALVWGPARWWSFSVAVARNIVRSSATWVPRDENSQYAVNVALRNLGEDPLTSPMRLPLKLAGYALAAATIAVMLRARRHPALGDARWQTVGIFLSLPWFMETTWPHYFVFLPFCQAILLDDALDRPRPRPLPLALIVFSVAAASLPVFNLFPTWRPYTSLGMLLLSNTALWAYFVHRTAHATAD